ncbi:MAG TPA: sialidase family protein [Gemmatimonadaceae bacterium]|nr:sialidase family protein [Gemmatimonadaceae bacterium]
MIVPESAVVAPLAAQAVVHVGPNVQVSRAYAREPHFEMQLAADPENADRLMACSMVNRDDQETLQSDVVTYVSFDRGLTWTPTLRVGRDGEFASWDPTCAYGPGGLAYSVSENMDASFDAWERIDRSTDGGRSWHPEPTRAKHGERTFLVVDHTRGPRRGWLYLYGAGSACVPGVRCANPDGVFLRASADGGWTIASEQVIPASGSSYPIGYGPGAVLSDGTLVAPFKEWTDARRPDGDVAPPVLDPRRERANSVIRVLRSRAGRPNWPAVTEVDTVAEHFTEYRYNVAGLPVVAVDASDGPFRDRLYAVWPDLRGGTSDILLSYSADSGRRWSPPRVVNDGPRHARPDGGRDALHGMVAVNRDGVVGIMWYDRRDHPDNLGWTVRFRASTDGGETFGPSVRVSEAPYDPARTEPMPLMALRDLGGSGQWTQIGVNWFHFTGGDHAGFTADAGGAFHALWVGNSTGVPQLWTSRITAEGTVHRNGSPALAALQDVGAKARVLFLRPRFVRATRTIEADLELVNTSDDTITGPLAVRVLDLVSESGVAEVIGADAGGSGEGAVWDLTALMSRGRLAPGERTRAKRVRIRVSEAGPLRAGSSPVSTLARFTTKVLAGEK